MFKANPLSYDVSVPAEEEPFLIFANRYYLRKLNLDGSNYTLLKQVRLTDTECPFEVPESLANPLAGVYHQLRLMQLLCFDRA